MHALDDRRTRYKDNILDISTGKGCVSAIFVTHQIIHETTFRYTNIHFGIAVGFFDVKRIPMIERLERNLSSFDFNFVYVRVLTSNLEPTLIIEHCHVDGPRMNVTPDANALTVGDPGVQGEYLGIDRERHAVMHELVKSRSNFIVKHVRERIFYCLDSILNEIHPSSSLVFNIAETLYTGAFPSLFGTFSGFDYFGAHMVRNDIVIELIGKDINSAVLFAGHSLGPVPVLVHYYMCIAHTYILT